MITEKDLESAIAECQGQRNPNANTCIKLASYYTILNQIRKEPVGEQGRDDINVPSYSYATSNTVSIESESKFAELVNGMQVKDLLPVFDELMETLTIVNPKLYESVMRKITQII